MVVTEVSEKASKTLEDLLAAIDNIPSAAMNAPKTIGEWSVKDILTHILTWEEEAARAFETWKIGVNPVWSHIRDIDEFNAAGVKEKRKLSLTKAIDQLTQVHTGIIESIKSVPDTEFARRGGIPGWLVNLISDHVNEHIQRILEYKNSIELVSTPPESNAIE
jgi:hypothetical protein